MGGSNSKDQQAAGNHQAAPPSEEEMAALQERFDEQLNQRMQAAFEDGVMQGQAAVHADAETQRMADLTLTVVAVGLVLAATIYSQSQRDKRHREELAAAREAVKAESTALQETTAKEVALSQQRIDELTLQLDTQRGVIDAQQREFRGAEERRLEERQKRIRAQAALVKQQRATAKMQKSMRLMGQQVAQARTVASLSAGFVVFSASALVSLAVFRRMAKSVFPPATPPAVPVVKEASGDDGGEVVKRPLVVKSMVRRHVSETKPKVAADAAPPVPPAAPQAQAATAPVVVVPPKGNVVAPVPAPPMMTPLGTDVSVAAVSAATPPVAVPAPPMVTPLGTDVSPAAAARAVAPLVTPAPPMLTPSGVDVSPAAAASAAAAAPVAGAALPTVD